MKIKYVILHFIIPQKIGQKNAWVNKKAKTFGKMIKFKFNEQLQGFTSAAFTSSFKQDL